MVWQIHPSIHLYLLKKFNITLTQERSWTKRSFRPAPNTDIRPWTTNIWTNDKIQNQKNQHYISFVETKTDMWNWQLVADCSTDLSSKSKLKVLWLTDWLIKHVVGLVMYSLWWYSTVCIPSVCWRQSAARWRSLRSPVLPWFPAVLYQRRQFHQLHQLCCLTLLFPWHLTKHSKAIFTEKNISDRTQIWGHLPMHPNFFLKERRCYLGLIIINDTLYILRLTSHCQLPLLPVPICNHIKIYSLLFMRYTVNPI